MIIGGLMALSATASAQGQGQKRLVLERKVEPRERAYSLLVPKGWTVEGGVFWVHPDQAGGPANSIEKKNELTLRRDASGTAMLRFYADVYRADTLKSGNSLFPYGTVYGGMISAPVPSAEQYIIEGLRAVRSDARGMEVIERKKLEGLARGFRERTQRMLPGTDIRFDAALVSVRYKQGEKTFVERGLVVIEDRGALFGGQWVNRATVSARAPAEEIESWDAVFRTILSSVVIDPKWLSGEIRGQMERAGIVSKTLEELQRIDAEIAEHRRKTNEEVQHDMYLTLTGQTELVDPFTRQKIVAPSDFKDYFVNGLGEVLMSNEPGYDPAKDPEQQRSDWKRMSPQR